MAEDVKRLTPKKSDTVVTQALTDTKTENSRPLPTRRPYTSAGGQGDQKNRAEQTLREYLQAPSYYQGEDGKFYAKRWQPDTPYIAYKKLFYSSCNLPLRLQLGMASSLFASLVFAATFMVMNSFIIGLCVAFLTLVVSLGFTPTLLDKWDTDHAPLRDGQKDVADQLVGFGMFSGLMIGLAVVLFGLFFFGYLN